MSDERHRGPNKSSPYPMSRLGAKIELTDLAREIEKAEHSLGVVTGARLEIIAKQIRHLQEEARRILDDAAQSLKLHHATCAFPKRIGQIYHLYEKASGEIYFSMLSPADWKGACPHEFVGSYRHEADSSWTPAEHIAEIEREKEQLGKLLRSSTTSADEDQI